MAQSSKAILDQGRTFTARYGMADQVMGLIRFAPHNQASRGQIEARDLVLQAAFLGLPMGAVVGTLCTENPPATKDQMVQMVEHFIRQSPDFTKIGKNGRPDVFLMGVDGVPFRHFGLSRPAAEMFDRDDAVALAAHLLIQSLGMPRGTMAISGLGGISLGLARHFIMQGWQVLVVEDQDLRIHQPIGFSASELGCCLGGDISALAGTRGAEYIGGQPQIDLVVATKPTDLRGRVYLELAPDCLDQSETDAGLIIPYWLASMGQAGFAHLEMMTAARSGPFPAHDKRRLLAHRVMQSLAPVREQGILAAFERADQMMESFQAPMGRIVAL